MLFKFNKTGRMYDICQINPTGKNKIWIAVDFKDGTRKQLEKIDLRYYTPIAKAHLTLK